MKRDCDSNLIGRDAAQVRYIHIIYFYIFFISVKVFVSWVKTGTRKPRTFSKLLGHLDKNSAVGTGPNTADD